MSLSCLFNLRDAAPPPWNGSRSSALVARRERFHAVSRLQGGQTKDRAGPVHRLPHLTHRHFGHSDGERLFSGSGPPIFRRGRSSKSCRRCSLRASSRRRGWKSSRRRKRSLCSLTTLRLRQEPGEGRPPVGDDRPPRQEERKPPGPRTPRRARGGNGDGRRVPSPFARGIFITASAIGRPPEADRPEPRRG